ncbi:MAG TPA: hypothetical protein VHN80_22985 [Kineosporiaceae bacterium]|nr:hypothetical protein [Kineosporiaceae bacterium]
MTGPEHYEQAQACLEQGNHVHVNGGDPERAALYFAEAHVHAVLALAAATAYRATEANAESPRGGDIGWRDAGMW